MDNGLFEMTVPVFLKTLGGMQNVLEKAQNAINSGTLKEEALVGDALAPDMFNFARQVRAAVENAWGAAARLCGSDHLPALENGATLAALEAQIAQAIAFLETVTPETFRGARERRVTLPYFKGKYMTGFDYAREYAVPNFFFHAVTAYNIVRKNGVAIGKADYINRAPLRNL